MRTFVAGHEPVTPAEFASLALGVDFELFAGVPGESPDEYAIRLDAAAGVLADLEQEDPVAAAFAAELLRSAPVPLWDRVIRVWPSVCLAAVA